MKKDRKEESRIYYLKNKDRIIRSSKEYYIKNKIKIIKRNVQNFVNQMKDPILKEKYYKKRREVYHPKYKRIKSIYTKRYRDKVRLETFNFLGGAVCKRCGFDDIRALQIDHIENDGNKERKIALRNNAKKYLIHIKKTPERYQVLCANCNSIKRQEFFSKTKLYA